MILDRVQVSHMAQMQNMLDFPPAPKLDPVTRRLDRSKATRERNPRRENSSLAKPSAPPAIPPRAISIISITTCIWSASLQEPPDGPIKTFTLRGIKESPPYLHDGRCLTLEDTVEFFNLVLELKLSKQEKTDLVAFLRVL